MSRRVIKPLARQLIPFDDKQFHDSLVSFISDVYNERKSENSLEELYRYVEQLVKMNKTTDLLDQIISIGEQFMTTYVNEQLSASQSTDHTYFLMSVNNYWEKITMKLTLIQNVFIFLDRSRIRDVSNYVPVFEFCMDIYSSLLKQRPSFIDGICISCLHLLEKERTGEVYDSSLMLKTIQFLDSISVYKSTFEPLLFKSTREYYKRLAIAQIDSLDVLDYISFADNRISMETNTLRKFFGTFSDVNSLIRSVQLELISEHSTYLMENGVSRMIETKNHSLMLLFYDQLSQVGKQESLRNLFKEYCMKRFGAAAAPSFATEANEECDKLLLQSLTEINDDLVFQVIQSFRNSEYFHSVVRQSLEFTVNMNESKPPKLLAKFVDSIMRGFMKDFDSNANDGRAQSTSSMFDKAMLLFRCIRAKDIFEAFYRDSLSKRLLLNRSSLELERIFISLLKAECGPSFTTNLEGMITDVVISGVLNDRYSRDSSQASNSIDIITSILTPAFWPKSIHNPNLKIPTEMSDSLSAYEKFFSSQHPQRKLQWHLNLGNCFLNFKLANGQTKELEVSFYQCIILMLFNEGDRKESSAPLSLPFEYIKKHTGIEDEELRVNLQSLACAKERVLTKTPKGREIGDLDVFSINVDYKTPLYRVRINTIQYKKTKKEEDATTKNVMEERGYIIDATIVRIMKSRKQLLLNALMVEVFSQLKFACAVSVFISPYIRLMYCLISKCSLSRPLLSPRASKVSLLGSISREMRKIRPF
jgi:cullin 4